MSDSFGEAVSAAERAETASRSARDDAQSVKLAEILRIKSSYRETLRKAANHLRDNGIPFDQGEVPEAEGSWQLGTTYSGVSVPGLISDDLSIDDVSFSNFYSSAFRLAPDGRLFVNVAAHVDEPIFEPFEGFVATLVGRRIATD